MAAISSMIMLGLAGVSAYKSLTDKGPAAPVLPPPPPPIDMNSVARARNNRRGAGRDPSLLTGPLGITQPPPTTRKTLLGS